MSDDKEVEPAKEEAASLDDLLAEMSTPEPREEPTELKDDLQEVVSFIREEKTQRLQTQNDTDLNKAVETVKGDLDVSDMIAEGWLRGKAAREPKVEQAFNQRGASPAAWEAVLGGLKREFQSEVKTKPNEEATEDADAVAAAVRSASTSTSQSTDDIPADIESMSEGQFEQWVKTQATR